jgi:cob(I)alamin adenosyltransferase
VIPPESTPRTDPSTPPEQPASNTGRKAAVPKRKKPGPYRVPPRLQRHGLLIVNTGDGKGKTTAALGVLLRARGRDMRVGMFQFVKHLTDGGEYRAAERLGIDIVSLGTGCTIGRPETSEDLAAARAGWARCQTALERGEYDVLVLDELTLPLSWGWLDESAIVSALLARAPGTHVIVTGRHASPALIEAADLVTEMRVLKHPFLSRGLPAQVGIDV